MDNEKPITMKTLKNKWKKSDTILSLKLWICHLQLTKKEANRLAGKAMRIYYG
jgi:hypothetical protein